MSERQSRPTKVSQTMSCQTASRRSGTEESVSSTTGTMELQKSVGQYVSEYVRESSAKARRKPGSRNSLAKRAKGQGNLNGLDPGETLILWGLLPLFEAANGL